MEVGTPRRTLKPLPGHPKKLSSVDATNERHAFETETERTVVNLNGLWNRENTDATQRAIQFKVLDALTRPLAQSTWCGPCKTFYYDDNDFATYTFMSI